ncbi:MAG TPA: tetratricopeptide repeat protein [Syntrophales bacterium]|nr:tetratricopeptide repeat protein [Syntrophales bacterium]
MRIVRLGIVFIFALVAAACGGTKEVVVPEHLSAGVVQTSKGMPFYERGCYARALEHFYRANELFTAVGDSRGMAMSMNNIGVVYRAMGEAAAAIPFFEDALRIYRGFGDREDVRQTLSNLAAAQIDTGNYASAGKNIDEALKIRIGWKPFAPAMTVKGILLQKRGDVQGAEAMFKEALSHINKRNPEGTAAANYAMGDLLLGMDRYKEAIPYLERAFEADREAGFYRGVADDLTALGRGRAGLREDAAAVNDWEQSVRIYALLGMEEKVRTTMGLLEDAAKRTNQDISLTRTLAERWLKGEATDNLCE